MDFVLTCQRIAAQPTRMEADNRTILSRLYYAFFLLLRDGLASRDPGFAAAVKNAASDHALVRAYLRGARYTTSGQRRDGVGTQVAWFERYSALFRWRETADYDMNSDSDQISERANEFMADVPLLRPLIESFAGKNPPT